MKIQRTGICGLVLLLALSLVPPAVAQEGRATTARHTLWKVEGRTNSVYLLGSLHLLKPEDYPLAAPLESAYSNAQIVVFETDIEKMEQPEMQLKVMSKAQLPEGETLEGQLSPAVYASFSKHAEAAGLPMMMFGQFKPALAAMTLEVFELQKLGLDPEHGVDKYFFERARKDGKQIMPLETVDFQINLITDFSRAEGELLVKTTLAEIDNTKKSYGEMLAAWRTGDAAKIERLMNEALHEAPAIFKRMVTDRNQRWIPQIEELLRGSRNAVVIVGAGHLVGNEGVVELLKKKGLKVTQW